MLSHTTSGDACTRTPNRKAWHVGETERHADTLWYGRTAIECTQGKTHTMGSQAALLFFMRAEELVLLGVSLLIRFVLV